MKPVSQHHPEFNVVGVFNCDHFKMCLSDYPGGLRQHWHKHREPVLILLLSGYTREAVGRRDIIAGPLDVGLKPAGICHTDHFWPKGVRALRIVLNPSLFAEMGELLRITEYWDWIEGSKAVRPLLRTASLLRQAEHNDAEMEEGLYDALAALLPKMTMRKAADAPSWLRQARDHLETSYASGVRLTHLARQANLHPVYFARQFRRYFGSNVGTYVRKLQTRAVAESLTKQEYNLAQIASHIGFSDQSHMTRTFFAQFGITPGQFRRLLK